MQAGELPETCCCCSSTRRSTRSVAARTPSDLPLGEEWTARARHRRRAHRPRRQAHLPRPGPARRLPDHARRRRRSSTCARWRPRSSRRSRARASPPARARARACATACTGVWVEDRKIASIGVHLSRGVSTHGFAVNVDNDLRPVRVGRAVRPERRADDLGGRRDRPRPAASAPSARGVAQHFCEAFGRRGARGRAGPPRRGRTARCLSRLGADRSLRPPTTHDGRAHRCLDRGAPAAIATASWRRGPSCFPT